MWANLLRFAVFALAAAIILALPYLRSWGRRGAAAAGFACLGLVALDPGLANHAFMTHAEPAWLDRVPPSIKHLQDDPDPFRIARFGPKVVLHPNLPMLYGLQDVGGYDSIILGDYARYLGAIEEQRRLWWNQIIGFKHIASLDSPLLPLLNIRYLLTAPGVDIDHPDWKLDYDGEMRVYRNRRERPRAFMVHRAQSADSLGDAIRQIKDGTADPAVTAVVEDPPACLAGLPPEPVETPGSVEIARYRHTAVEITSSSEKAGIAVLCDMMYPGWRAYVDGHPADIMKVDGIFRGVFVPAGDHRVSFRFEPDGLRRGWMMLGGGLAIVILGVAIGTSCLLRRPKGPPFTPAGPSDPAGAPP